MTRIRREDTSVLPAQARSGDGHTHPLPRYVTVWLIVFAIGLATCLVYLWTLSLSIEQRITSELDRRSQMRDEQYEQTNRLICRVLTVPLADSPEAADLARNLRCP